MYFVDAADRVSVQNLVDTNKMNKATRRYYVFSKVKLAAFGLQDLSDACVRFTPLTFGSPSSRPGQPFHLSSIARGKALPHAFLNA